MSTTKLSLYPEDNLKACPCVGETLDKLVQPAILAILAQGPMHGYRLVERLGAMPSFDGRKPDASGVYRVLKVMERRGLVVFAWDASQAGPAKRTYQITPGGQQCLGSWVRTLEQYRNRITSLLNTARSAAKKGD
jgi:DNA-binding PadR family transcriptional regulator